MSRLALDPTRSRVRVRTFAEGLLARLAHDLELVCRGLTGSAEPTGEREGSASIEIPLAHIEVAGTVKHGRLEPGALSSSERGDILAKMRREVFHAEAGDARVRVEGTLGARLRDAHGDEEERARLRVTLPSGRAVERVVPVRIARTDGRVSATGNLELSLAALGSETIKGPMNAFRVRDSVEVLFELVFAPSP